MNGPRVPQNREAEEALLGSMMLSRPALEDAIARVTAADLHDPFLSRTFATIVALHASGRPADPLTVAAEMTTRPDADTSGLRSRLLHIHAQTPASVNVGGYIAIVIEMSERRSLLAIASTLREASLDGTTVADAVTTAEVSLSDVGHQGRELRHPSFDEWAPTVDLDHDWLVPGVLERGDRLILVSAEGLGKSTLLREWAIMLAAGIHWFSEREITPARAMIVDVENSARQIVRSAQPPHTLSRSRRPGWEPENLTVIPLPRLDLLRRADRMLIESYLMGHRPDLLILGPLYKIFGRVGNYEEDALAVCSVLDDWRARFGCAILIEHHAPKGSGGKRDMDPAHSAVWLRWPEFGLRLEATDNPVEFSIGHFRGQREPRHWPALLTRGAVGDWHWKAPDTPRF